jgi:hypothetical protein
VFVQLLHHHTIPIPPPPNFAHSVHFTSSSLQNFRQKANNGVSAAPEGRGREKLAAHRFHPIRTKNRHASAAAAKNKPKSGKKLNGRMFTQVKCTVFVSFQSKHNNIFVECSKKLSHLFIILEKSRVICVLFSLHLQKALHLFETGVDEALPVFDIYLFYCTAIFVVIFLTGATLKWPNFVVFYK